MHDFARSAVLEVADSAAHVGDDLGVETLDDVTVIRFASLHPGYPGWQWAVAVVGDNNPSINEIWMEPGEGALPVPAWKPWSERVRPGDLGAGDVIATDPDDPRLAPGYQPSADGVEGIEWSWGLGRERVLSSEGLTDAVDRWRSGENGPEAPVARLAPYPCSTCAWLLPIGGLLGQAFGVCAHDISPSDGHVVSMDHGCGAHSYIREEPAPIPVTELLLDDEAFVPVRRGSVAEDVVDSARPALEAVAPADDMPPAPASDEHTGEGDITPPEMPLTLESSAE